MKKIEKLYKDDIQPYFPDESPFQELFLKSFYSYNDQRDCCVYLESSENGYWLSIRQEEAAIDLDIEQMEELRYLLNDLLGEVNE